jgi:hypothetical protein
MAAALGQAEQLSLEIVGKLPAELWPAVNDEAEPEHAQAQIGSEESA